MPTIILAASLSAALCIASVHDGDSLRLCSGERVRIANIDAPELPGSPRCLRRSTARKPARNPSWCDPALAYRSRDALRAFVAAGPVTLRRQGRDRYGRTLARLTVNGRDAGAWLIAQGLARRWR